MAEIFNKSYDATTAAYRAIRSVLQKVDPKRTAQVTSDQLISAREVLHVLDSDCNDQVDEGDRIVKNSILLNEVRRTLGRWMPALFEMSWKLTERNFDANNEWRFLSFHLPSELKAENDAGHIAFLSARLAFQSEIREFKSKQEQEFTHTGRTGRKALSIYKPLPLCETEKPSEREIQRKTHFDRVKDQGGRVGECKQEDLSVCIALHYDIHRGY